MKRTIALVLTTLLLTAALCGCGSGRSDYASSAAYPAEGAYDMYYPYAEEEVYDAEYGYAETAALAYEQAAPADPDAAQNTPETNPQKIIYTADVDLETLEFDAALEALAALTESCGGYYAQSSVSDHGSYRTASYTVRVPAQNYRAFLGGTDGLGHVRNRQEQAEDVSESYYDTAGRLETQNTKLSRLQELLAEAENMEDIIVLEEAISETEEAIDRLSGQLRHYDSLVDYSTVYIDVREVYEVTIEPEPVVTFSGRFAQAFGDGIASFLDGLEDIAIALAYSWLWLVLIAAVVVIVLLATRKKRAERRELRKNTPPAAVPAYSQPAPEKAEADPSEDA